jgi:flagellar hook-associated protein 2
MGTASNAIFTGSSQFSQDLQSVVKRAVDIASLPITQMKNDLTDLQNQSTALTGLDTKFAALQTAAQQIQDAMGGAAYEATISDPAKLSATLGDGAMEGVYSVQVVSAGSYGTSMTTSGWSSSGSHTYQLTLDAGTTKFDITPADTSIASVAAAINSQYSDKVRAIVVNVGSSSTPAYRISLQAVQLGSGTPDILDTTGGVTTNLQTGTAGSQAEYIVNGVTPSVHSTSRAVSIAHGVTVNLLAASTSAVNITVTRSTSTLSDALSAFATAFNAAVDEVDKQHGTTAGALSGQRVVNDLAQTLSGLATYSAPGSSLSGLPALGLSLDRTGHLTFSPFALMAADMSNSAGVASFIGTPTRGGFLQTAIAALNQVLDPVTGSAKTAESDVQTQITDTNKRINAKQDQVDQLQQQLLEQMSAVDALIASMEQQYSYIGGMFQAMQVADQQYR